jgi:hypothetical protein
MTKVKYKSIVSAYSVVTLLWIFQLIALLNGCCISSPSVMKLDLVKYKSIVSAYSDVTLLWIFQLIALLNGCCISSPSVMKLDLVTWFSYFCDWNSKWVIGL